MVCTQEIVTVTGDCDCLLTTEDEIEQWVSVLENIFNSYTVLFFASVGGWIRYSARHSATVAILRSHFREVHTAHSKFLHDKKSEHVIVAA